MISMAALVQLYKSLVLLLVRQRQYFAGVYIRIMISFICLSMKNKIKTNNKMSTFQLNPA